MLILFWNILRFNIRNARYIFWILKWVNIVTAFFSFYFVYWLIKIIPGKADLKSKVKLKYFFLSLRFRVIPIVNASSIWTSTLLWIRGSTHKTSYGHFKSKGAFKKLYIDYNRKKFIGSFMSTKGRVSICKLLSF